MHVQINVDQRPRGKARAHRGARTAIVAAGDESLVDLLELGRGARPVKTWAQPRRVRAQLRAQLWAAERTAQLLCERLHVAGLEHQPMLASAEQLLVGVDAWADGYRAGRQRLQQHPWRGSRALRGERHDLALPD